jgi:ferredoxin-2, mitochondrial
VTFIDKEGETHKIAVSAGDNLLDIAQAHDLEMEGTCAETVLSTGILD